MLDRREEDLHCNGIVGPINNQQRGLRKHLDPSGQACAGQSLPYEIRVKGDSLPPPHEDLCGSDRHRRIHLLVHAQRRKREARVPPFGRAHRKAEWIGALLYLDPHVFAQPRNRGACLETSLLNHGTRLRLLGMGNHGAGGLDDSGLLGCNQIQRVPQLLGVIQPQSRQNTHIRQKDIRRIQPAPQTHFQDRRLHVPGTEVQKADSCHDIEEGWRHGRMLQAHQRGTKVVHPTQELLRPQGLP